MFKISGLGVGYGDLRVLEGVDINVEEGKVAAILGSNGAGKTTLLRTLSGLIRPWEGTIEFQGQNITGLQAHNVAELGIVYVPEGRKLFNRLSVLDNLLVGSYMKQARLKRKENLEFVFSLFPVLEERKSQLAGTLSGGEQQMLAIARGLMSCPKLLLLDEPSLGIAPVIADRIFKTIRSLQEHGLTMILSEQNVRRALQVSNVGFVIQTGRLVTKGNAKNLGESEEIQKAYLGM